MVFRYVCVFFLVGTFFTVNGESATACFQQKQHRVKTQKRSRKIKKIGEKICDQSKWEKICDQSKWEKICDQSKNAIIQIYSIMKIPKIFEPFKSPDEVGAYGSGFFIDKTGYVLTNYHVVENAEVRFMLLPALGDERFKLEFVGGCPEKDFALLKLSDKDVETLKQRLKYDELPHLELGDSDQLVVAQKIVVLGYPLGMKNLKSVMGISSGRDESKVGESIQTNAAINHGNSGGPALEKTGKVVGISVCKAVGAANEDVVEGIAFLIPINDVKILLNRVKQTNIVRLPYWGFEFCPTTVYELSVMQAPTDGGVFIKEVKKDSLFETAGVKKEDILYEINGVKIDRYGYFDVDWSASRVRLFDFLMRFEIDSTITLTIYRNGEVKNFTIYITDQQPFKIMVNYPWYEPQPRYDVIGGIVVSELSMNHIAYAQKYAAIDSLDTYFITKYGQENARLESRLMITRVLPDSQADETRCFDTFTFDRVLKKINDIEVKSMDDFHKAVRTSVGKKSLKIETEGGTIVILSVDELVVEDAFLRERYPYKKSPLIDELEQGLKAKAAG